MLLPSVFPGWSWSISGFEYSKLIQILTVSIIYKPYISHFRPKSSVQITISRISFQNTSSSILIQVWVKNRWELKHVHRLNSAKSEFWTFSCYFWGDRWDSGDSLIFTISSYTWISDPNILFTTQIVSTDHNFWDFKFWELNSYNFCCRSELILMPKLSFLWKIAKMITRVSFQR